LQMLMNNKDTKDAELLLRVTTENQQKEMAQFLFSKSILLGKAKNISTFTSNPVLESSALAGIWQTAGAVQSKRRRVYRKVIS